MRRSLQLSVFFFSIALGALSVSHCTTLESGRKSIAVLPESQMHQLGAQAFTEMKSKEKLSPNQKLTAQITGIAQKIADASGADFKWEFKVFDSDQVNAFCLPGGKIGIYTGILPIAKTNAGLAAIIGHEVAHATLKHGNERMSQGVMLQFGLQASQLAFGDSSLKTPIMAALGLGAQYGAVLPFGRFQEKESDEVGLKYLVKAGFDAREASAVWGRMGKLKGGSGGPEWLSTHPNSASREKNLAELAAKSQNPSEVKIPTQPLTF